MTYYRLLGVSETATLAEIKAAYHAKAKALHPDVNPGAGDLFAVMTEAYGVLSDPAKRATYDRSQKLRTMQPASEGIAQYVSPNGEFNFMAIAGRFTPAQMQGSVLPLLNRFLSDRGIDPEKGTVQQVLQGSGLVKPPRKVKRHA